MNRRFKLGSSFGVMQGRLSRQSPLGYQVFPQENWECEFLEAANRRLEHIEWVIDETCWIENPIINLSEKISTLSSTNNVRVLSACLDIFMTRGLETTNLEMWNFLDRIVEKSIDLEIRYLILPFVDENSALRNISESSLMDIFKKLENRFADSKIKFAIESDLPPIEFKKLMIRLNPELMCINYDLGNSASLGYSYQSEMENYLSYIEVVHIKDRLLGGKSVPLGTGNANIKQALNDFKSSSFRGIVTMQAYRNTQGLMALDEQLDFMESCAN
jgi:hexulose-6-phosphate isomerase